MPLVKTVKVEITTARRDVDWPVMLEFNGHQLPFDTVDEVDESHVFRGGFTPNSFAHSVLIVGPETGEWEISGLQVTYDPMGHDPYTVHFGEITLDSETSLDIWQDPPLPTFEV